MKKFFFLLIVILGSGYLVEIIAWPVCLINGWENFKLETLIKVVVYLLLALLLYFISLRKNKKAGI